jgi:hypothetical protein
VSVKTILKIFLYVPGDLAYDIYHVIIQRNDQSKEAHRRTISSGTPGRRAMFIAERGQRGLRVKVLLSRATVLPKTKIAKF